MSKNKSAGQKIDQETLLEATRILASQDSGLARIYTLYGPPPLWAREPGFPTLVHIILEQQVSLASAKAAFDKLNRAIRLTPKNFLNLDDATLKSIGFSHQKSRYVRLLAQSIEEGFDLKGLEALGDLEAKAQLMQHKGIGYWTADIYLLMALGRADIWPAGDLALQIAAQRLLGLPERPTGEAFEHLGNPWKPWRSVAARLLWHFYLSPPKG